MYITFHFSYTNILQRKFYILAIWLSDTVSSLYKWLVWFYAVFHFFILWRWHFWIGTCGNLQLYIILYMSEEKYCVFFSWVLRIGCRQCTELKIQSFLIYLQSLAGKFVVRKVPELSCQYFALDVVKYLPYWEMCKIYSDRHELHRYLNLL